MRVLTDTDVARDRTAEIAVAAAHRALVDAYAGRLSAPPRARVELGGHGFVFTAGGYADGPVGFRAYGLWPGESDQAVLVWDGHGALAGVVAGGELGARRTGALGGVAADVLARADARRVAIVGSGRQAWSQLWAIAAVRPIAAVAIHSPTADHRERFAQRARTSQLSARRRRRPTRRPRSWRTPPRSSPPTRPTRPAPLTRPSSRAGRSSTWAGSWRNRPGGRPMR